MSIKHPMLHALLLIFILTISDQSAFADQHEGEKQMANATEYKEKIKEVLIILSSDSLQTQGMAMVLSHSMLEMDAKVNVLLCDKAGDLALENSQSYLMKPKNVSPKMLLRKLKGKGALVTVCALYLPNNDYSQADLLEGVEVAKPDDISSLMTNPRVRVFTF